MSNLKGINNKLELSDINKQKEIISSKLIDLSLSDCKNHKEFLNDYREIRNDIQTLLSELLKNLSNQQQQDHKLLKDSLSKIRFAIFLSQGLRSVLEGTSPISTNSGKIFLRSEIDRVKKDLKSIKIFIENNFEIS